MLKITKPSANRVDLELEGGIDGDTMRQGLDDLFEQSADVTKGRMLYRIVDFSMPTAEAIGVELRRLPQLFALVGRFERCAVLSDERWLRQVAEIEGALFPGLEIKSFELKDAEAAEAGLAET